MPVVQIDLFPGRSVDQKRELVSKVTEAICSTLDVKPQAVSIILRELELHHYANCGKLRIDQ